MVVNNTRQKLIFADLCLLIILFTVEISTHSTQLHRYLGIHFNYFLF